MLEGLQRKAKTAKRGAKSREKWFLYILRCSDGSLYTGVTKDLARRFKMHQAGRASRYTRSHGPVEMVYSETCHDRSSALIRECEVKEWPRPKKEQLIRGEKINSSKKKRKAKSPKI